MAFGRRFGVGRIDRVVAVDREPAHAAELAIFADILAILGQDLDSMVVTVGDDQPPLESNSIACGVRNSPGPVPVLPIIRRNLPLRSNTEMRPTRFGSSTLVWLSAT